MKADATFVCLVDHKTQNVIVGFLSCYAGDVFAPRFIRRIVVSIGHTAHLNKDCVDVIVGKQVHIFYIFGLLRFCIVVSARPIYSPYGGHPYAAQFFFGQLLGFYDGFIGIVVVVTGSD